MACLLSNKFPNKCNLQIYSSDRFRIHMNEVLFKYSSELASKLYQNRINILKKIVKTFLFASTLNIYAYYKELYILI